MENLELYTELPPAMKNYLSHYGWHFSKEMCQWAVSRMKKKNKTSGKDERIQAWGKQQVDDIMKKHNINLEDVRGYDYVYIANMVKADFLGSSIPDEQHLALYVKDAIDDVDGYTGMPFVHFYADCCHKGIPIDWEDML